MTCPLKKLPVGDLGHLGLNIHAIDATSEAQVVQPHQLRATTLDAQLQQYTGSVPKAGKIPVLVQKSMAPLVDSKGPSYFTRKGKMYTPSQDQKERTTNGNQLLSFPGQQKQARKTNQQNSSCLLRQFLGTRNQTCTWVSQK